MTDKRMGRWKGRKTVDVNRNWAISKELYLCYKKLPAFSRRWVSKPNHLLERVPGRRVRIKG
jgi:hypothetical protein